MKQASFVTGALKGTSRPRSCRLRLEVLEVRNLLTTLTVDHLADDLAGNGANGSLRYCLTNATDSDTIVFGVTGTIDLTGALPDLAHNVNIQGPGADLMTVRRDTGGDYRVFKVDANVTAGIFGLTIANGVAIDSNGGGGVLNLGTLTISDCTVTGNAASPGIDFGGGGVDNLGTLTINNTVLSGNTTGNNFLGGAIDNNGGTLTVSNSILSGNVSWAGAGIVNAGTIAVSNSIFVGNMGVFNGAIINGGALTISDSTFVANTASGNGSGGGAIYNLPQGTLTCLNSTVSGNSAYYGGGFANQGVMTLLNDTVAGNSASDAGGILDESHDLHMRNTIVANNMATGFPYQDIDGRLASSGYNLVGNPLGGFGFDQTDVVGADPLLGPLQDNGGPTQTMALQPGSPALDAGDPAQLGVAEQRGVVRTGGVNIGAYQASASGFVLTAPRKVTAGTPFDVTVAAVDSFGQLAPGYTGTVTFSTTDPDPRVVLPADYPFTLADGGMHTFTDTGPGEITLRTRGHQTITATDTGDGSILGNVTVKVRHAGHALTVLTSVARGPAKSDSVLTQAPIRQSSEVPSEGQPVRSEAGLTAVPFATERRVRDAVLEQLDDPLIDALAWHLIGA